MIGRVRARSAWTSAGVMLGAPSRLTAIVTPRSPDSEKSRRAGVSPTRPCVVLDESGCSTTTVAVLPPRLKVWR